VLPTPAGAPTCVFLDDLLWLDAATLELLEHVSTDPDGRHLMLMWNQAAR